MLECPALIRWLADALQYVAEGGDCCGLDEGLEFWFNDLDSRLAWLQSKQPGPVVDQLMDCFATCLEVCQELASASAFSDEDLLDLTGHLANARHCFDAAEAALSEMSQFSPVYA